MRETTAAPLPLAPAGVLQLQRVGGNQAVARLLESTVLRRPVPAVQRGNQSGKEADPTYEVIGSDRATFNYVWQNDTPAGGRLEVHTESEPGPIGYAAFSFHDMDAVAPPEQNEPYGKEHVLGRQAGRVCHLTGIYNLTLTRDGPADIYRGFANTLMDMVEEKARERGAHLVYLEPAKSAVRQDPNNNAKQQVDPTEFYTRRGYSLDAQATQHNRTFYLTNLGHLNPTETQIAGFNRASLAGTLTKRL